MTAPTRHVLLIDDDPDFCRLVEHLLSALGYRVSIAASGAEALRVLSAEFNGVILLDVKLPDIEGPAVFQRIRKLSPENPVIFLTGYPSMDLALDSILQGAFEFIDKPDVADRLERAVARAFESLEIAVRAPRREQRGQVDLAFPDIVTQSTAMHAVLRSVRNAIDSRVTVLIRGESGTGKELIARAIHENGPRRGGPLVTINCAGSPEHLLEAELFGYESGAIPGATERQPGRLDAARHGTLLLDEIDELPAALQAKLLRVIQDGEYKRLGGLETQRSDARLLSSSHRDLEKEVEAGRFREDLYYRLAAFTVHLPPLRERYGDVAPLSRHFLATAAQRAGKSLEDFDSRALELLESYSFPGNVRELENIVGYAASASAGPVITIADLPPHFLQAAALDRRRQTQADSDAPEPPAAGAAALRHLDVPTTTEGFPSLQEMERRHILAALELANNNKAQASRMLGISRMTLYRKLRELEG